MDNLHDAVPNSGFGSQKNSLNYDAITHDLVSEPSSEQTDRSADVLSSLSDEYSGMPKTQPELSFEQKVDAVCALLTQNPLNRSILYCILITCAEKPRLLEELEGLIIERKEYASATQPPYSLVQWLEESGALDTWALGLDGNKIMPQNIEGLTDDEVDDLISTYAFKTNLVGEAVIREYSPQSRLTTLLNISPAGYDTYIEVLEFLKEKRSLVQIDRLLRGRKVLTEGRPENDPMHPSVFIDRLFAAGCIIFNDGWVITSEGKELLDTIQARRN